MTKRLLFTLALVLFSTTGCNLVYKQNIQQGNALEQEDLDKLRIGMSMNQVAFLLGTPAIQDPFHHNRWDYVSSFSRRGDEAVSRKIIIYFENGSLSEMIGVESDEFIFEDETEDETGDETGVSADSTAEASEETAAEVSALATPESDQTAFDASDPQTAPPVADDAGELDSAVTPASAAAADEVMVADPEPSPPTQAAAEGWVIQLGAFEEEANARLVLDRLTEAGYPVVLDEKASADGSTRFLVRQYGINSESEANDLLAEIQTGLGINGFLLPLGQ